jgi:hypothetical protein
MKIAANLTWLSDWASCLFYKDQMHQARAWQITGVGSNWDYPHGHLGWNPPGSFSDIPVDANGWPLEIPYNGCYVNTVMLINLGPEAYPFGAFTLQFEGKGTIYLGWDAAGRAPSTLVEGYLPADTATYGHTVVGTGGITTFQFSISSSADFYGWYSANGTSTGIN